jgi:hypothetical protein
VFWISAGCGERLVYGATVVLLSILFEASITHSIPVTAHHVQLVQALQGFIKFQLCVLLESAFVVMCYTRIEPDLTPVLWQNLYSSLLDKVGLLEWFKDATEETKMTAACNGYETAKRMLYPNLTPPAEESGEEGPMGEGEGTVHVEMNALARRGSGPEHDDPAASHRMQWMVQGMEARAVRETSGEILDGWLRRIGYERFEARFRATGIQSLSQLTDCNLSEVDLLRDMGIESILARRRMIAQLHKLTGQDTFERNRVDGIVKQLRAGYTGENDTGLRVGKVGRELTLVTNRKAISDYVEDPEEIAARTAEGAQSERQQNVNFYLELREMKNKAVHAYWVNIGELLDRASQLVFPLAFAIYAGVALS